MRFQVPQFIEVEDKIFGSLTLKQSIYLAGGGGLSFLIYALLDSLLLSLLPIVVIMGISIALAFYKINRKPFVAVLESAFKYYLGTKLYIWKKEEKPRPQDTQTALKDAKSYASVMVPKISDSKLKDLTWSLDIKESMYSNNNQR
jgi:PrgI family protein